MMVTATLGLILNNHSVTTEMIAGMLVKEDNVMIVIVKHVNRIL